MKTKDKINRNKTVSIRLADHEFATVQMEAKRCNMNLSVYARYRILPAGWDETFHQDIDERYAEEKVTGITHEAGNKLIQLQQCIEKLPRDSKNRKEMEGLVNGLWHTLF